MKNNEELQKDVQDAIKWEPLLQAAQIGVTTNDGIVTLTGTVDSYTKKLEAESAAKNVAGVKALVEKIKVEFANTWSKSDSEVAKEAVNALKWSWQVPSDKVKVKVEDGWVTLDGTLSWNYQKTAAKEALISLSGVKGVTNDIKIESESHDEIEKADIVGALNRNWSINAEDIQVEVSGTKVTLSGTVLSWYQRDEAEKIAWNAPGVWTVDNQLVVDYEYSLVD
jgi:osmotically-inducible protein OsmY